MAEERISRRPLTTRDTKWAQSTARWLGNIGLRPNTISILSVLCGALAGAAFVGAGRTVGIGRAALFLAAAAGIQLRLLCNLFDGMVAVEGGFKTKSGEIYNELPDRFSDAVILVCAGYAMAASETLHALGWLAAVLSVITAYVRALGASAGTAQHFAGPMAKPQRMALLTVLCVAMAVLVAIGKPVNLVHPALALISIGCLLTIARRVRLVVRELESKMSVLPAIFAFDPESCILVGGVLALLVVATILGQILRVRVRSEQGVKTVRNLNARTYAWWAMAAVFGLAMLGGMVGSVILFALISFVGLREFLALAPRKPADRGVLLWVFCLFVPLQYWLVAVGWYGLFATMIPVYAFLFVPLRGALGGDCEGFLERTARIQWGLMICVYCVSHAPALLFLSIPGYEGQNVKLLFYFVLVVQISDVMQYVWGKTLGRHRIAPLVSPNKTWEGFVGGIATATLIGTGLWWATPYTPLQAAGMSLAITLMGFAGGLVMSAIKRDQGVKDYGTLIGGHGGVMDRIDSICFAAPVFFHLTRFYFA